MVAGTSGIDETNRLIPAIVALLCNFQHGHNVGWFGDWIAVLPHGTKVHFHRIAHQLTRLVQRAASRHAAREIRLGGMYQLPVAALLIPECPSVFFQRFKDIPNLDS
jgi:hypothetical protein